MQARSQPYIGRNLSSLYKRSNTFGFLPFGGSASQASHIPELEEDTSVDNRFLQGYGCWVLGVFVGFVVLFGIRAAKSGGFGYVQGFGDGFRNLDFVI